MWYLETSEYGVTSLNREIAATMAQLGDQHARGEVGGEFCRRRESNPGNDHGRGGTTASLKWTNPNLVWGLQHHEGLLKKTWVVQDFLRLLPPQPSRKETRSRKLKEQTNIEPCKYHKCKTISCKAETDFKMLQAVWKHCLKFYFYSRSRKNMINGVKQ